MLDHLRAIARHRYAPVLIWAGLATLVFAWFIVVPYVPAKGVTVREDTTNFTMFDMSGDNYAAILAAVDRGELKQSDLREGFRLFTRGTLSKRQLAGRVRVGGEVVAQYIERERAAARPTLVAIWAVLALLLPGLYLGGRALLSRRSQPLTAPPVRPEMM